MSRWLDRYARFEYGSTLYSIIDQEPAGLYSWTLLVQAFAPPRTELAQNKVVAHLDQPARQNASNQSVRQSVSLPSRIAKRVRALAETRHTTASRVLVDLIETGLQTKQAQHQRFFELTDQLAESTDPAERKRLQEELARISCCK